MTAPKFDGAWRALTARARPIEVDAFEGPVLALVPHADDETLGLGGLLHQLCARGVEVHLVLVTDGVGSHPNSATHTPEQRTAVREQELLTALELLGAGAVSVEFWRKPDTQLPRLSAADTLECIQDIFALQQNRRYNTWLTPWRNDPHGDHEAIAAWTLAAWAQLDPETRPVLAEYCVWLGHQGSEAAFEGTEGHDLVRLDVREQRSIKLAALEAHESQMTNLFNDPTGFTLPPSLQEATQRDSEYYFLSRA